MRSTKPSPNAPADATVTTAAPAVLTASLLGSEHGLVHGFSTLQLGSVDVKGERETEGRAARARFAEVLGVEPAHMIAIGAVHGARVARVDGPVSTVEGVDGLMTDRRGLSLFAAFADCYPILLFDPERRVVALGHAGWRGTAAGIAGVLVHELSGEYGCDPATLLAVIGPGICQACYEVGEDVARRFPDRFLRPTPQSGKYLLDIAGANVGQLVESGLEAGHVEVLGVCTSETAELPSHRRDHDGRRFGAAIALT